MGKCAMFGADAFKGHVVSRAVLMAEALLNELGWEERGAIYVPQLHCCAFKDAITGSAARAEAAALQVWRRELDLDAVAKRVVASALLLPFVEPAPELRVTQKSGQMRRMGKASVYVVLNKEHTLIGSTRQMQKLHYHALTDQLLEEYCPLVIDDNLVVKLYADAVAFGTAWECRGQDSAQREVSAGRVMVVVVEAEAEKHAAAAAAASKLRQRRGEVAEHVMVIRDTLRASGASHILNPNGAVLTKQEEAMANRVEAQALGLEPERLHHQFFDREGAASGYVDAETAEELIGASKHVRSQAAAEWGQDLDFMAATDTNGGTRTVAMSYISGERAKARMQASQRGAGGQHAAFWRWPWPAEIDPRP